MFVEDVGCRLYLSNQGAGNQKLDWCLAQFVSYSKRMVVGGSGEKPLPITPILLLCTKKPCAQTFPSAVEGVMAPSSCYFPTVYFLILYLVLSSSTLLLLPPYASKHNTVAVKAVIFVLIWR